MFDRKNNENCNSTFKITAALVGASCLLTAVKIKRAHSLYKIEKLPSLANMNPGVVVLTEPHQAHKIIRRKTIFSLSTVVVSGYIPAGATVVRPNFDGFYYGHARRASEFVPTHIAGYIPFFTKCYGGASYANGIKTIYKPYHPVKPQLPFDTDISKQNTSGIHLVDTRSVARNLY